MKLRQPTESGYSNFLSTDYLHVNNCGSTFGNRLSLYTYRPNGRIDWQILYQVEDTYPVEYEGEWFTVTPGDILVFPPNVPQYYECPLGSRTLWVHFSGTAVESIMSSLGLSGGVTRGTLDSLIVETFRHLSGLSGSDYASITVQNSVLLMLLGFLARNSVGQKANLGENLVPAIQLMREEYSRHISIAECAALCHMSECYFSHVFHESIGMSPRDFLKDIRMGKACDLLKHTDLSISKIAELCGYSDPLYFSRLFSKEFGLSPRTWRK